MKITLVVLFLSGLTIYCKCAAVLSLPPSVIAHAASLDDSLRTQKPCTAKDNDPLQQLLTEEDEEEQEEDKLNEPTSAADLYRNFKNLWHNDLSLNLQKREERNIFDDDIDDVAAMQLQQQQQQQQQQTMAAIKKTNQNQNALQPHDNDNVDHKNYNHNNNNNKNENNILRSSATSLPYLRSSAATNMNEATNFNLNMQPQLQFPLQKITTTEEYDDTNKWLSSSPEMIDGFFVSPPHQTQESLPLKRRELENMPLVTAAPAAEDSAFLNRFLKSRKYWSTQCPLENENNCLQEYYGALIADRNNALLKQLQNKINYPFAVSEKSSSSSFYNNNNNANDDDIVLLLTAEQNLIQFLSWALSELYPYGKFTNATEHGADSYDPGMYIWKKLNLSGRIQPPLLVEEPQYVIVRRDYDQDENYDDDYDIDYERGLNYDEDPFIPPRGRKHNLPDLDSLLQRYETFVPNRGRRDKIKDIFKYDDLFYPNRGKRQMTTAASDNVNDLNERNDDDDIDIKDIKVNQRYYNNEQNTQRLMKYFENLMGKMKRKLQETRQKLANIFDKISNRNEPTTRMSTTFQQAPPVASPSLSVSPSSSPSLLEKRLKSTINILHNSKKPHQQHLPNHYNARRQWWKRYTTAKTSTMTQQPANINARSPTMATNRLQTTLRSMSFPLQQLTQLYQQQQQPGLSPPHLRSDKRKFMRQQQQKLWKSLAQQFDPLSWHKLQMLLQQRQQQSHHYSHSQPLLSLRHPRLTALQHLPDIQQEQQQLQPQLATPQETQLTYSNDQLDNSITNDPHNIYV